MCGASSWGAAAFRDEQGEKPAKEAEKEQPAGQEVQEGQGAGC